MFDAYSPVVYAILFTVLFLCFIAMAGICVFTFYACCKEKEFNEIENVKTNLGETL